MQNTQNPKKMSMEDRKRLVGKEEKELEEGEIFNSKNDELETLIEEEF
jgi:hypothetical protein